LNRESFRVSQNPIVESRSVYLLVGQKPGSEPSVRAIFQKQIKVLNSEREYKEEVN
jgi:hypothetical protein